MSDFVVSFSFRGERRRSRGGHRGDGWVRGFVFVRRVGNEIGQHGGRSLLLKIGGWERGSTVSINGMTGMRQEKGAGYLGVVDMLDSGSEYEI